MDMSFQAILDELSLRLTSGPFQFRLIVQPTMAAILGVRAGIADAESGAPPFLWGVLSRQAACKGDLKTALRHLTFPILIATALDALVQYLMFGHIHPLSALSVGTVLMALPYSAARGLTNRIQSRRARRE
jgi:hypothetical protein